MTSFLTGITVALVLAAGTYFVFDAGTITQVERSDDLSTRLDGIWEPMSPATMSVPLATQGNVEE